ncbi:hypothetical protein Bbelb_278300 [Branchiostoma belcheri]|nr:hypothetical protein Bbelb_278300 [Branchiostoma belcheri]
MDHAQDTERSQSKQETRLNDILTLQTVHHSDIAALVVAQEDPPEMKVQVYQRPGAPIAGLMMYARLDGTWYPCGCRPCLWREVTQEQMNSHWSSARGLWRACDMRIEEDERLACLQPYIQAIDKAQAYETQAEGIQESPFLTGNCG